MSDLVIPLMIGFLFAVGLYLMLRQSLIKLIFGLVLVGNATNLLVFTASRLVSGGTPIVRKGDKVLQTPFPDPLGQALILTAIVISFGTLAFVMVLIKRAYDYFGTDDVCALIEPEEEEIA
ncbi:MAG: NADH-quinone oxidoreductase subunit K [Armatimonadetes bacterium]|nr:NADH-quinone oxidoreductase subunit K [Armatimonadota bacterium]